MDLDKKSLGLVKNLSTIGGYTMKSIFSKTFSSLILVLALVLCCAMPAFAAEVNTENDIGEVASVNNVTLPAGINYTMFHSLTFTNYYITDEYNVQGRWINLAFNFRTADNDQGIDGIWLTVDVYDASNDSIIYTVRDYVPTKGDMAGTDFTFDLGENIRNVYFKFDASSYGESNGHYRSATMTNVRSYVFG